MNVNGGLLEMRAPPCLLGRVIVGGLPMTERVWDNETAQGSRDGHA